VRTYNNKPRPRVLLEDIDESIAERIRSLVPTSMPVSENEPVYGNEFDVLITSVTRVRRDQHMHVVAFGSTLLGSVQPPEGETYSVPPAMALESSASLATEIYVPDDIKGELGALVQNLLVPFFIDKKWKPALRVTGVVPQHNSAFPIASGRDVIQWCRPFVVAGDGSVLAASFKRLDGGQLWALPRDCPDPEAWVAIALKEFRELDPERVPALPAWWENTEWATTDQRTTRELISRLESERERIVRKLDQQLMNAREDVVRADEAAIKGVTRLLTEDGDGLVSAVKAALERFGFEVDDMDEHFQEGRRREDLRVRDPSFAGWEALVEVKGYSRGASVNDLARITRWAMLYSADNQGHLPDAQWHIVNAFRGLDPAIRPQIIPDDDDLRDFTTDGGLLVDTRQIFKLLRDVDEGRIDSTGLRARLRNTCGRLDLP
jgi:hypothetical protein